METSQIVALLVAERDRLNNAIEALQGTTKRRGRPPGSGRKTATFDDPNMPDWVKPKSALNKSEPKKKRRKFSKAQREAAAERMRQRWAAKKKAEAKTTKMSKSKKTAKAA
jgi:hypothetical protein